ncbi:MAG: hypothetical protein AB1601_14105 [Planctomycetota bacterium]
MNSRIGKRVRILGGMQEFVGLTGTIVDVEKHSREPAYYRVRLDTPVEIPMVGLVRDDLWQGRMLKTIRAR